MTPYNANSDFADVAVIGGGAAGMAAAIAAKHYGAKRVILIEKDELCGGVLNQCVHSGFGALYFGQEMTGVEYAEEFRQRLALTDVELLLGTTVVSISDNGTLVVAGKAGVREIKCGSVVLSSGCYERPIGTQNISSYRPLNILTAGTVQRMINIEGKRILGNIVVLGSGDIGLIVSAQLKRDGANVTVIEKKSVCGGLLRNRLPLEALKVPIMLNSTVVEVHGEKSITGVTVQNDNGNNTFIPCDLLITSLGLIPDKQLVEKFSSIPKWLFICGNANFPHNSVDEVTIEAEYAGANAAAYSMGNISDNTCSSEHSAEQSGNICVGCPIGCHVTKTENGWEGIQCSRTIPILPNLDITT